jgi:pimeloyl-ACP methyl ester carboxylesterase
MNIIVKPYDVRSLKERTQMPRKYAPLLLLSVGFALVLASTPFSPVVAQRNEAIPQKTKSGDIRRIEYGVPHTSTVPANLGQSVKLYLREVFEDRNNDDLDLPRRGAPVVLFVHGGTVSSVPDYDLQFEDYSWAEFLARAGFDVFMMDHTGYGFSPRPMMSDPCNTNPAQQNLLVPNPLAAPCPPSYPFQLTTSQSDWDEINTVVDFIRAVRGVERVNLVGWSAGGPRIGGFAFQHPEKVDKLLFYASGVSATAPNDPPPNIPRPGFPMSLQSHEQLMNNRWDAEVGCQDQFDPDIRPVVWRTIMQFDPLGSTWFTPEYNPIASPAGGVMRTRTQNPAWGWNTSAAAQIQAPTLLIVGLFDPVRVGTRGLYDVLGSEKKVRLEIACASHFVVWERQHQVLLEASRAWFRNEQIMGVSHGVFTVDEAGRYHRQ